MKGKLTTKDINYLTHNYGLSRDIILKIAENTAGDRRMVYDQCSRLYSYQQRILDIFKEDSMSSIFDTLEEYSDKIDRVKYNNESYIDYINGLDDDEIFIINKNQLLSFILSNSNGGKRVNNDFISIIKLMSNELSLKDIFDDIDKFNKTELNLIEKYAKFNYKNENISIFNKSLLTDYLNYISQYKLNEFQKNDIYEYVLNSKMKSIDDMFKDNPYHVIAELAKLQTKLKIEANKERLIQIYGEEFVEQNKDMFTDYVLSRNVDTLREIIDSEEFKQYPELASATVLGKSSIKRIRQVLDNPCLTEPKYEALRSPSLFTKDPKETVSNIILCNNVGLDKFTNNITLVVRNRHVELMSKINFLNYFNEPLCDEETKKLHPLLSCDNDEEIKEITKSISDKDLSRNDLIKLFNTNVFDNLTDNKNIKSKQKVKKQSR